MTAAKSISKKTLITKYMNYRLDHEKAPVSIFKFCREKKIKESDFYNHFGSFEGLQKGIWVEFHNETMNFLHKNKDYEAYTNRDKLLTYFFTLFELLTLNRSYVLLTLNDKSSKLENLEQLKGIRKHIKSFSSELIQSSNENKSISILKRSETLFSEATWIQFLFLLKFWMGDDSAAFEKTDAAIEKSVNTAFDLFDNTPLERIVDFGKFIWQEQMS